MLSSGIFLFLEQIPCPKDIQYKSDLKAMLDGASSPESNKSIKGNKRRKVEEYTSSFAMLTNMVGLNVSLVIWFRIIRTYCVMIACLIAESLFSFRQIKAASDGYSQGISKAQLKTMGQTLAYKCTDQDYPAPATFRVIPLEQMRHLAASQNLLFNIQFRFFTRFLLTEKEKRKKFLMGLSYHNLASTEV